MHPEKLARINELAKKSRTEGLTTEEKQEQEALRNEYRRAVVGNLRGQLDNTVIVEPDGSSYRPKDEKKK
ncbi:DUF896 domain-containing protein [Ruminococcus sp. CAG:330]|uniref:DUF896 domain-containing protein n=1 Tax=Ruminococcus sp. CAG:330 TaxID=1262954 RepID=UPI00033C6D22|nr:DUF896 domain-containing protein [Ruminococcus sp. CAG:330]CDE12271.1 uPF0291 protein FAEPRAA2165_03003 [Ruminococcus sp. CAG:330]